MRYKELHENNRRAWNEATLAHNSHKIDQASFFRHGGHTLFPEEIALLGDLAGLDAVHLQCNAGQDTLSLVQLGARVTGVDISDSAIDFAQKLSEASGIPANFIRSDVYDWLAKTSAGDHRYDLVFSSYGALVWLSDIFLWAEQIKAILVPGGRLVVLDFHPFAMIFDDDWSLKFPYFGHGEPMTWDSGIGDYVAMSGELLAPSGFIEGIKDFTNPYPSHEFQWGVGEIITAVLQAGLRLTDFSEYPYSNGARLFQDMVLGDNRRLYPPAELPDLPLMFGLVAKNTP